MNVYVDVNGNMYADTSAHSANDQQVTNPSAALIASLTTTPEPIITAEGAAATINEDTGDPNNGQAATDSGGAL